MIEILKPDFEFDDERGSLIQLVHDGYKQVNMCFSKAGVERGGHFHAVNKETFYIISGKIRLSASCEDKHETYDFSRGDMFAVKRNVMHSLEFFEDTVMIVMYDNGVELSDGTKDIISI